MSSVLVPHGTKHGSTAEIGETLRAEGHEAVVSPAGEVDGLHAFDVFGGRIPPDPGHFMERSMLKGTPEEKRDARDFEAIAGWARSIAEQLRG